MVEHKVELSNGKTLIIREYVESLDLYAHFDTDGATEEPILLTIQANGVLVVSGDKVTDSLVRGLGEKEETACCKVCKTFVPQQMLVKNGVCVDCLEK